MKRRWRLHFTLNLILATAVAAVLWFPGWSYRAAVTAVYFTIPIQAAALVSIGLTIPFMIYLVWGHHAIWKVT